MKAITDKIFKVLQRLVLAGVVLVAAPIAFFGTYQYAKGWPQSWNAADWSATGTAPDPATETQAVIRIYAARTGRWKSIFAVHTWIAVKPENAPNWTRYDVVGWGKPLRRNAYPVDGKWYSNHPRVIYELKGDAATRLIPNIEAQISTYRYAQRGDYSTWPGPNSNTFVATIVRSVPGLDAELPATAIGKDFLGSGFTASQMPSKTGWQASWNGIIGAGLSWREGLEFHVLGTTLGIDPMHLAIKLPGIGRISPF
jgi:hypothetical protein